MTFGYSRDDVGKFLPIYLSKGILQSDPFEVKQHQITLVERSTWSWEKYKTLSYLYVDA